MTNVTYRQFRPSVQLLPFIECYWELKGSVNGKPDPPEQLLPDGCAELIFNLADPIARIEGSRIIKAGYRSYIVGQSRSAVHIQPLGAIHLFGVSFRAGGAYPFLRLPLNELTDQIIPLDLIWSEPASEIEDRIGNAGTISGRIRIVEDVLFQLLSNGQYSVDHSIVSGVRTIISSGGSIPINALANNFGIGRRRLEKNFARYVGISPKSLARIIRFQEIFHLVKDGTDFDWADAVFKCGYFDQAHLIKDFKAFCGRPPTAYFNDSHHLARHFRRPNRGAHSYKTD
jgi:AraC-like DNA-binding protein